MVPDQQRLSPEDRSNLVAYLDGELNDAQSRAIATKLTQSTTARREADAFRKTWELLDLLPRPRASDDFTERTLTVATQGGALRTRMSSAASVVTHRLAVGLACGAASAILFLLGYLVMVRIWPDPTARLARDLPIAESLDEYLDVGTFDYLEKLDVTPEFN